MMTEAIDPSGLRRMLAETLSALTPAPSEPEPGADPDEPVEGVGHGADGLIEVRLGPPGRVTGLHLDPRVLRLDGERLAAELTVAIDEALAALRARLSVAAPDLGALTAHLRDVQEETGRQLGAFTDSLFAAQEMLVRRAGGDR
ncbi:YbaB/EbfC family nucleoid-associated protein [Catenuloplanes atrovinosus]|uniref:DNA-binding protein YbaB n=1 Tax=Catenuloplanes atrovinosus TaxID=137266 RepID=A0AAE3YN46_9ACTN|nr:YbaB/EbfC family nucleoid-associated protein [Catenuloplanes atrovinosus]MDR7276112.1 DNA-binding protein YbaB [Catenuloplanes atrovinosus]